jgi:hypothetical protein
MRGNTKISPAEPRARWVQPPHPATKRHTGTNLFLEIRRSEPHTISCLVDARGGPPRAVQGVCLDCLAAAPLPKHEPAPNRSICRTMDLQNLAHRPPPTSHPRGRGPRTTQLVPCQLDATCDAGHDTAALALPLHYKNNNYTHTCTTLPWRFRSRSLGAPRAPRPPRAARHYSRTCQTSRDRASSHVPLTVSEWRRHVNG